MLADRMSDRDSGNKPSSGDRIPFVYIKKTGKCLQGDRIEHPCFIGENNLKLDYEFYITNQIMKPVISHHIHQNCFDFFVLKTINSRSKWRPVGLNT